jgi:hypothetical protein
MSYETRRENPGGEHGDVEGVRAFRNGGVDGESLPGVGGEGGVRGVASADTGGGVGDGRLRGYCQPSRIHRKAYEAKMAWLYDKRMNPDLWMLRGTHMFGSTKL